MQTLIFKVSSPKALDRAVRLLRQGKVVIYPTETSYGIGCSVKSRAAIKAIYRIKKRNPKKPLLVLVDSLKTMQAYGRINGRVRALVKYFMPGPLTLVVDKTRKIPKILNEKEIAFRISSHPIAFKLTQKLGAPLTSASANLEGKPNIYSAKEVIQQFKGKVALIIDAGNLKRRKPSTLFDIRSGKVLRKGLIKEKEIMKVLRQVK